MRILRRTILLLTTMMSPMTMMAQHEWTAIINNPSFEKGTSGWTLETNVSGWEDYFIATEGAADGIRHYNIWAQRVKSINIFQNVSLPAGKYTLSAQLKTNTQGLNNQHVYAVTKSGVKNSGTLASAGNMEWKKLEVDFSLDEKENITIGARSTGNSSTEKGWFCIDDFRLYSSTGECPYQSVEQVTSALTLNDGNELHITGNTPFSTTGFVDLADTEHTVVYFDGLRPSSVIRSLSHITIKGQPAASEQNCQLRPYDHGTLLLPYGAESKEEDGFHPLTVYSERNCQGTSCNLFGIENTNGYMNTLTDEKLNNQIRSFTLKRGYMVTFALQNEGYGYQRCFIASDKDLVVNELPDIMDKRISSYRIFRFNNIGKNGVANITDQSRLRKLNCTWTYTWGAGQSLGTDYECVPHMNHLWSNSTYSLGANDQSPYLKTDNEPGNNSDPSPATVLQELERWNDMMRTGRRLLTPSSHDGSINWFTTFLDSIDSRGWRCDVLDIHCYWNEGTYNNIKSSWVDRYKRPVWITEFIWGASWSGGLGIFSVATTSAQRNNPSAEILEQNKTVLTRIWNKLNDWDFVERYAYWNDEANCSKIMINGNLTPAGEVYAQMETGTSYSGNYDFVPTNWRLDPPKDLTATLNQATHMCTISWTTYNGDLANTMALQRRVNSGTWETLQEWTRPDQLKYSYRDELTETGNYEYRIHEVSYKNTNVNSPSVSVFAAYTNGTEQLQYGTLQASGPETMKVTCKELDSRPIVFMGIPTNSNSTIGLVPHISSITNSQFTFNFQPWNLPGTTSMNKDENIDFLAIKAGNYHWGDLRAEVDTCQYTREDGTISKGIQETAVEIFFNEPFPEGIIPVVIVQPFKTGSSTLPVIAKAYDITNQGFKVKLLKQKGETGHITSHSVYYMAITPGSANLDERGKSIFAGRFEDPVGGSSAVQCYFLDDTGERYYFKNPYIIAQTQTLNLDYANILRRTSDNTLKVEDAEGNTYRGTSGIRIRRQMDSSLSAAELGTNSATENGDYVGYIVINNLTLSGETRISAPVNSTPISDGIVYDLQGRKMPQAAPLLPGIYIRNGHKFLIK